MGNKPDLFPHQKKAVEFYKQAQSNERQATIDIPTGMGKGGIRRESLFILFAGTAQGRSKINEVRIEQDRNLEGMTLRCSTITPEFFLKSTGRADTQDDLERCNCPRVGESGHEMCGWNWERGMPIFQARFKGDRVNFSSGAKIVDSLILAKHVSRVSEKDAPLTITFAKSRKTEYNDLHFNVQENFNFSGN